MFRRGTALAAREARLLAKRIGIALCGVLLLPAVAAAQQTEGVRWEPSYRRASLWDGAVIAGGGLLYLTEAYVIPERTAPVWEGPILWDSAVRDVLRLNVRGQRETVAKISDYLFTGSVIHNLLFDNLVVAWAIHGEPDVAFQMSVMDLEAYAVSGAITGFVKLAAGRSRPFVQECERDFRYTDLCGAPTSYRAFFSAHAATTAVGAGLLCAHHLHMPLYDGGVVDIGTCGLGIALTLATGAFRIASDRHWSTDVTMGHLVGFASGYFIPTLFYYEWGEDEADAASSRGDGRTTAVLPSVSPDGIGLQVVGLL